MYAPYTYKFAGWEKGMVSIWQHGIPVDFEAPRWRI